MSAWRLFDGFNRFDSLIIANNIELIEEMLNNGYDINAKEIKYGMTGLMRAIQYGNKKMMKMLLNRGADVNIASNNGWTALIYSIFWRTADKDIMMTLLKNRANVDSIGNDGMSVLDCAIMYTNEEIVKDLVDAGAHINQNIVSVDPRIRRIEIKKRLKVKKYLDSIDTDAEQRRINFLSNLN